MKTHILIGIILGVVTQSAWSAAWTKDKNNWVLINNFQQYYSTKYWSSNGELLSGSEYRQSDYNPYFEYGVTDTITLGGSAYVYNAGQDNIRTGLALVNAGVFGQFELWRKDWQALSIKLGGYAPFSNDAFPLTEQADINSGNPFYQWDIGGMLMWGTGGVFENYYGSTWFLDVELGYDQYYQPTLGQYSIDFYFGWKSPKEKWLLEIKSFNSIATSLPIIDGVRQNYNLYTITPGLVYFFTKAFGVEVGVAQAVAGKNISKGTAPFVAIWLGNE